MADRLLAGIDLGGTKTEIAVLDRRGVVRWQRRVSTPAADYGAIVETLAALVAEAETAVGAPVSVGIGTPGAVSPFSGLLRNSNTTCLNGRPLKQDLEARLGRPLRMANDADCLTLSEATDGAGRGAPVVFGVILGTGTGGGVAVHGKLLGGPNAITGEWGHNPLPWPRPDEWPGPECYCGKRGCIETFLSGPGMATDHTRHSGEALDARRIAARAAEGNPACRATLARYADRLARALAQVINILDPHVIVLGGGLSRIEALYALVPQRWGRYVFSDGVATRLRAAAHGDASGVRGAAWLWRRDRGVEDLVGRRGRDGAQH